MLCVLDFSDAFWNVPLCPRERRFFVARIRGRFYLFLRTAQGSRGGPLTWCRLAALVSRLTQGALVVTEARVN
eukprot:10541493-Lingulodinium_polyedra.AAC.1